MTKDIKIVDALKKESVIPYLQSKTKPEVIKEIADCVTSLYSNINSERLVEVLMERKSYVALLLTLA